MSSTTDYDDSIQIIPFADEENPGGGNKTGAKAPCKSEPVIPRERSNQNILLGEVNCIVSPTKPAFVVEDVAGNRKAIYPKADSFEDIFDVEQQVPNVQENDTSRGLFPNRSLPDYLDQEDQPKLPREESNLRHFYTNGALAEDSIHQNIHTFLSEEDNCNQGHQSTYGTVNNESIQQNLSQYQYDEDAVKSFLTSGYFSDEYSQPPTTSGTQTCLLPESLDNDEDIIVPVRVPKKVKRNPEQKKVAKLVFTIAGVFILAGFVLVGVTLSMSRHIDDMVKQMQGPVASVPSPPQIVNISNITFSFA